MKKKIAIVTILSIIVFCLLLVAISITKNSIFNAKNENITEENRNSNSSVGATPIVRGENNGDNTSNNNIDEKSNVFEVQNDVNNIETTNKDSDYEVTNKKNDTNELPGVPIE